MEFQVGDKVMLKVLPWKGVLELPEELSRVHNTFHVSNLKKCYADEPLAVPLDGLHFDDKLHFVEEPVEIMDREVKRLKRSRIPIIKVRWNSRRGPEFTWEREDQFRKKYPHLFTKTAPSSITLPNPYSAVSLGEQREVVDAMARDFSRFTVWAAEGISQLLDSAGATYVRYSETHIPYQRRRVRQGTGKGNTSAAPLDENQPDL
ncbi:hypothetical protein Tco_0573188 [Tanacetum coccineum]